MADSGLSLHYYGVCFPKGIYWLSDKPTVVTVRSHFLRRTRGWLVYMHHEVTEDAVSAHRHDWLSGPPVQGLGSPQGRQGGGKIQTLTSVMPLLLNNTRMNTCKFFFMCKADTLNIIVKNILNELKNQKGLSLWACVTSSTTGNRL